MNTNDVVISSNDSGRGKKRPECGSGRVVMFCVAFHIGVPFDRFPANCGFAQQFANTFWGSSNVRVWFHICGIVYHIMHDAVGCGLHVSIGLGILACW